MSKLPIRELMARQMWRAMGMTMALLPSMTTKIMKRWKMSYLLELWALCIFGVLIIWREFGSSVFLYIWCILLLNFALIRPLLCNLVCTGLCKIAPHVIVIPRLGTYEYRRGSIYVKLNSQHQSKGSSLCHIVAQHVRI